MLKIGDRVVTTQNVDGMAEGLTGTIILRFHDDDPEYSWGVELDMPSRPGHDLYQDGIAHVSSSDGWWFHNRSLRLIASGPVDGDEDEDTI